MALIRVKNLQSGKTGQLPEENFDPNKYSKLSREDFIGEAQQGGMKESQLNELLTKSGEAAYSQPIEAKIASTGLFDIPVLGGLLRGMVNPAEKYGRFVGGSGYEAYRAGKQTLGDKNAYVNQQTGEQVVNPFLDRQELETFSDPQKGSAEMADRTLGMMLAVLSLAGLPKLPRAIKAILQPGKTLGKMLETKISNVPEAFRNISKPTDLLNKLTKSNDLAGVSEKTIEKVAGPEINKLWPEIYKEIPKTGFIKDLSATGQADIGKLFETSRTINKQYSSSFFKNLLQDTPTSEKARIMTSLNREIRPLIKEYAKLGGQDISGLDKILSTYYRAKKLGFWGGGAFGGIKLFDNLMNSIKSGGNSHNVTTEY